MRVVERGLVETAPLKSSRLAWQLDRLEAAARQAAKLGFTCITREDICEQPIEEGCELLLSTRDAGTRVCDLRR